MSFDVRPSKAHTKVDELLINNRFPRVSRYHPAWVLAGVSGGANPLWLTEWLAEGLDLRPGSKVLDLGCGRAISSISSAANSDSTKQPLLLRPE
jgi:ubiquinone/menaquinone biosynthesis C-methylase UbiE